MSEEELFLREISERPDDDAPRLICADYLEEHGDPDRADFIRVQCQLAKLTADSPRRRELALRSRQLRDEHGERWAGPIRPLVEEYHFKRGFVEKVVVSAETLARHAGTLFRLAPIQRFRLTGAEGDLRFLGSLPPWARVTSLDLVGNDLGDEVVPAVTECPALQSLRRLVLCCNRLRDPGADALCEHPFFRRLRELQCDGNPFSVDVGRRLAIGFGPSSVSEYRREEDHLYAFQDGGYGWHAGLVSDHLQVFAQESFPHLEVYYFDREGNPAGEELRTLLGQAPENAAERIRLWDQRVASWRKEVNLRPGTIRVKRFETRDAGIVDFEGVEDRFNRWDELHPQEREEFRQSLREYWLKEGVFIYTDGNGPYIGGDGTIHGH